MDHLEHLTHYSKAFIHFQKYQISFSLLNLAPIPTGPWVSSMQATCRRHQITLRLPPAVPLHRGRCCGAHVCQVSLRQKVCVVAANQYVPFMDLCDRNHTTELDSARTVTRKAECAHQMGLLANFVYRNPFHAFTRAPRLHA